MADVRFTNVGGDPFRDQDDMAEFLDILDDVSGGAVEVGGEEWTGDVADLDGIHDRPVTAEGVDEDVAELVYEAFEESVQALGGPVEKAKTYVDDPSEAPEDADVQEGPEGGLYYEDDDTPDSVDALADVQDKPAGKNDWVEPADFEPAAGFTRDDYNDVNWLKSESRDVSLDDIKVWQSGVEPEKVKYFVDNPDEIEAQDSTVSVVRHNGENVLVDGTHRTVAARLLGRDEVEAEYVSTGGPVEKAKTYVGDPSEAPEDADVQEGPMGGYYYEDGGSSQQSGGESPPELEDADSGDMLEAVGEVFDDESRERLDEMDLTPDEMRTAIQQLTTDGELADVADNIGSTGDDGASTAEIDDVLADWVPPMVRPETVEDQWEARELPGDPPDGVDTREGMAEVLAERGFEVPDDGDDDDGSGGASAEEIDDVLADWVPPMVRPETVEDQWEARELPGEPPDGVDTREGMAEVLAERGFEVPGGDGDDGGGDAITPDIPSATDAGAMGSVETADDLPDELDAGDGVPLSEAVDGSRKDDVYVHDDGAVFSMEADGEREVEHRSVQSSALEQLDESQPEQAYVADEERTYQRGVEGELLDAHGEVDPDEYADTMASMMAAGEFDYHGGNFMVADDGEMVPIDAEFVTDITAMTGVDAEDYIDESLEEVSEMSERLTAGSVSEEDLRERLMEKAGSLDADEIEADNDAADRLREHVELLEGMQ